MSWGTIRKATEEDEQRLEAASQAFYDKYHIFGENLYMGADSDIYYVKSDTGDTYEVEPLLEEWLSMAAEALGHPQAEGIAYGYVGYHID